MEETTLTWRGMAMFQAIVIRGEQRLTLQIGAGDDGWVALAIETRSDVRSPEQLLTHHAHRLLGSNYSGPQAAMNACYWYAQEWSGASAGAAPLCECTEIGPAP